jgi:hypothetical protein
MMMLLCNQRKMHKKQKDYLYRSKTENIGFSNISSHFIDVITEDNIKVNTKFSMESDGKD